MAQAVIRTVYKCCVKNTSGPEVYFEFPNVIELKRFIGTYSAAQGTWTYLLYKLVYEWDDSAKTISVTETPLTAADL